MSTPCTRLDDYLGGRLAPDAEAAFERHLADCDACEAASAPLAADLRALADVACPPEVVTAALRAARQTTPPAPPTASTGRGGPRRAAPDRPARRARAGRRWMPVTLAVLGALVVAALALRGGAEDTPPAVAERVEPRTAPDVPTPLETAPETAAPEVAQAAPPRPAPPTTVPDAAPPSATPPVEDSAAEADPAAPPDEPTAAEVEAAADDLRLAFALVGDVQRRADRALRDEAGALGSLDHALPHFAP